MDNNQIRKHHWDSIYTKKALSDVSWFEEQPTTSLELIREYAPQRDLPIIDVGGGSSYLVDRLLDLGYLDITVLDISEKALDLSEARLGERASQVHWSLQDVTLFISSKKFFIWHDRVTFHFLRDTQDVLRYCKKVDDYLLDGGYVLIATFSKEGPKMCSGLEICQYSEDLMTETFGRDYELIKSFAQNHKTPTGTTQNLIWTVLKKLK